MGANSKMANPVLLAGLTAGVGAGAAAFLQVGTPPPLGMTLEKPGTVSGLIGSDTVGKMELASPQSFALSATARVGAAAAVAFAMVGGQKTRRKTARSSRVALLGAVEGAPPPPPPCGRPRRCAPDHGAGNP